MPRENPPDYDTAVVTDVTPYPPDPELGLKVELNPSNDHRRAPLDGPDVSRAQPVGSACNVVYTYIPRWPLAGEAKETFGPLYPSRQRTVDIVKKSFVDLQDLPSGRIGLSCPIETAVLGGQARWTIIRDESWAFMVAHPPSAIRVQVADLPGEAAAREAHYQAMRDSIRCHRFTYFFFGIAALVLVIVLPVYFTQR